MPHPWRVLRDYFPHWDVRFAVLPNGLCGCTEMSTRTIWLDSRLNQAERRSTLLHELLHVISGHTVCDEHDDAAIEQAAARYLLPLDQLVRVLPWAHTVGEAADELWVDVDLLTVRLEHLHPSERAAVKRAVARRDNEEET